jgi:hypothetical protein
MRMTESMPGLRFSVSQALMACSETPMTFAASRALQWWK